MKRSAFGSYASAPSSDDGIPFMLLSLRENRKNSIAYPAAHLLDPHGSGKCRTVFWKNCRPWRRHSNLFLTNLKATVADMAYDLARITAFI